MPLCIPRGIQAGHLEELTPPVGRWGWSQHFFYQMYPQDTSIILEQRTARTCLNFEQHSIFHASMPLAYVIIYVFIYLLVLGYFLTYLAYLLTC